MSEQKHSPLPWKHNGWTETTIESRDGRGICSTGGYTDSKDSEGSWNENVANGKFIIKAVNNHDKLVKLLEQSRRALYAEGNIVLSGEIDSFLTNMEADNASQ